MGSYKIDVYVLHAPAFLSFFWGKYWSADGPLRPKLVASSTVTMNIT